MDPDEMRRLLRSSGADIWALIDVAIAVAARDHGAELRARRDAIVEQLYVLPLPVPTAQTTPDRFRNCGLDCEVLMPPPRRRAEEEKGSSFTPAMKGETTPSPPESTHRDAAEEEEEEEDLRGCAPPASDEKSKVLAIKDLLEDPDQSEDSLVRLLQNLADTDITFSVLKKSDIGRHVNGLRKHPSGEIRRLVKQLVRKWKYIVDEYVDANSTGEMSSLAIVSTDGDSPQQFSSKNHYQSGHNQVPELGYSPSTRTDGYLSSDRSGSEPVAEPPKARAAAATAPPRREAPPTKPNNINHSNRQATPSSATPMKSKEQKEMMSEDRLASARKRLQANYQEADNAKRQRTIQVMDIHEIPKLKGSAVRRGGFHAKHW